MFSSDDGLVRYHRALRPEFMLWGFRALAGPLLGYCDGSGLADRGPAGCGVVVVDLESGERRGFAVPLPSGTNNVAELGAMLALLCYLPSDAPGLIVRSDSQYAIGMAIKDWRVKANPGLVAALREELAWRRAGTVTFEHVRGHKGEPGNEFADRLASLARHTAATRAAAQPTPHRGV